MTARYYVKKPIPVCALQWDGMNTEEVLKFCPSVKIRGNKLVIPTLEGDLIASKNDYIIKGVQGEYYPCKPDIFSETYEPCS